MKLIIAGSRDIDNYELVKKIILDTLHEWFHTHKAILEGFNPKLDSYYYPTEIVSGRCPVGALTYTDPVGTKVYGVDGLGERFAEEYWIKVKPMPGDWARLGRSAGPMRNHEMAVYADCLIAIYSGESRGTKDMITKMKGMKKLYKEIEIE